MSAGTHMYGSERNLDHCGTSPNIIFFIDTIQDQDDTISNYKERTVLLGAQAP